MSLPEYSFDSVVETVYKLTLEEKQEIKKLLEGNIAEARRDQITEHAKKSKQEEEAGKLQFSSNTDDLKKLL